MKRFWNALVLSWVLASGFWISNKLSAADVSVGVSVTATADFYAPLTPMGTWVEVGGYGRCWRPTSVAVGWRPYCDGHWEWTDCGWYWVSDEPWAWACYHYGNWVFVDNSWCWAPGIEWAPAWVYWRNGGGYCGWAPCPPRGVVVAPSFFVFVEDRHFRDRHRSSTVIVNNTTIINKTREINVIKREDRDIGGRRQRVVVNEGPGVADVQKATGKKIDPVPVAQVDRRTVERAPAEIRQRRAASASGNQPADGNKAPTRENKPSTEDNGPSKRTINNKAPADNKPEINQRDRKRDRDQTPTPIQPERRLTPAEKNVAPVQPGIRPQEKVLPKPEEKIPPTERITPPERPAPIVPPGDDKRTAPLVPQTPSKDIMPVHPTPPTEHREVAPGHAPGGGEGRRPEGGGGGEERREGGGPGRDKDKP